MSASRRYIDRSNNISGLLIQELKVDPAGKYDGRNPMCLHKCGSSKEGHMMWKIPRIYVSVAPARRDVWCVKSPVFTRVCDWINWHLHLTPFTEGGGNSGSQTVCCGILGCQCKFTAMPQKIKKGSMQKSMWNRKWGWQCLVLFQDLVRCVMNN